MAHSIVIDKQSVPGSVGQINPLPVKEFGGNIIMIQYHSTYTEDPEYIGMAVAGSATSDAVWQIRKIAYSAAGKPTSILYADGDLEFNNVWDTPSGLSYS